MWVLNLDVSKSNGIHWVCYYKNNEKCYYCDWDNAQSCELIGDRFQLRKFLAESMFKSQIP